MKENQLYDVLMLGAEIGRVIAKHTAFAERTGVSIRPGIWHRKWGALWPMYYFGFNK